MDLNRPLALVSVGGVVLLAVGALVGGLLGWPASGPAAVDGVRLSVPAAAIVAALLVGAVTVAVVWGVRTAPGDEETPYWNS